MKRFFALFGVIGLAIVMGLIAVISARADSGEYTFATVDGGYTVTVTHNVREIKQTTPEYLLGCSESNTGVHKPCGDQHTFTFTGTAGACVDVQIDWISGDSVDPHYCLVAPTFTARHDQECYVLPDGGTQDNVTWPQRLCGEDECGSTSQLDDWYIDTQAKADYEQALLEHGVLNQPGSADWTDSGSSNPDHNLWVGNDWKVNPPCDTTETSDTTTSSTTSDSSTSETSSTLDTSTSVTSPDSTSPTTSTESSSVTGPTTGTTTPTRSTGSSSSTPKTSTKADSHSSTTPQSSTSKRTTKSPVSTTIETGTATSSNDRAPSSVTASKTSSPSTNAAIVTYGGGSSPSASQAYSSPQLLAYTGAGSDITWILVGGVIAIVCGAGVMAFAGIGRNKKGTHRS